MGLLRKISCLAAALGVTFCQLLSEKPNCTKEYVTERGNSPYGEMSGWWYVIVPSFCQSVWQRSEAFLKVILLQKNFDHSSLSVGERQQKRFLQRLSTLYLSKTPHSTNSWTDYWERVCHIRGEIIVCWQNVRLMICHRTLVLPESLWWRRKAYNIEPSFAQL